MDLATMSRAFAGPGMDTRQWVSYGIVDEGENSVRFVDENGAPLPTGPLVTVTLEPSHVTVPCRVAGHVAGQEEGEWFPFLPGDEVLVVVPEGDERAGCTIIGRMNQSIDRFPLKVAGQDVTKNTFGFKRLRTPYIIETSSSFMIRSALTGAGLTIDQTGNCYFISGDGHRFAMHASFLKLESEGGKNFLQIDPTENELLLQGGETTQFVLGKSSSAFFTMGTLDIGTGGVAGGGHAVTTEQMFATLLNFVVFLKSLGVSMATWDGAVGGGPSAVDALYAPFITGAATPAVPFTGSVYGSVFTALPLSFGPTGAILAGLLLGGALPPDPTGVIISPGIGRANLTY